MNIEEKIEQEEKELKKLEEENYLFQLLRDYNKSDKVINSFELDKELKEKADPNALVLKTRIPKLDQLAKMMEGDVVVVSAPTGNGKTSFLQTLTCSFAQDNINCLWLSYEVANEELFRKFPELPSFSIPRENIQGSFDWMERKIAEARAKFKSKVVFIDHLHYLISIEELMKTGNTSLLIGMMMRRLKKLAIDNKIIVFLVAHMKKSKFDETPTIEDLRDSSFVAQESDLVLMMWRHREKDPSSPVGFNYTLETRLTIVKNRRTGELGWLKMLYQNNQFKEIDEHSI